MRQGARTALWGAGGGGGMVAVEYLELTGAQWVDSGIIPDSTTDAEIECAYDWAPGAILAMLCGGAGYHDNEFGIVLNATSESGTGAIIYEKSRTTDVRKKGGAASLSGVFCKYRIVGSTAYFGATTVGTFSDTNISTTNSVYIGATHRNGVIGGEPFDGMISYCKLWKSGALVRDFIPVRVGTTGYMYDRVSGGLFENKGSGKFIVGPDLPYQRIGLVAMYDGIDHGTDNMVWVDSSLNGNDATQRVQTGWSWGSDCYIGTDGGGQGFTTPASLVSGFKGHLDSHTVEVVFKPDGSYRSTRMAIFGQYNGSDGSQGGFNLEYSPHLSGYYRSYYNNSPNMVVDAWKSAGSTRLTCATVCDGSSCKAYVNGVLSGTTYNPASSGFGDNAFILGGENGRGAMSIRGRLYAVRIYFRALSGDELVSNFKEDNRRYAQ